MLGHALVRERKREKASASLITNERLRKCVCVCNYVRQREKVSCYTPCQSPTSMFGYKRGLKFWNVHAVLSESQLCNYLHHNHEVCKYLKTFADYIISIRSSYYSFVKRESLLNPCPLQIKLAWSDVKFGSNCWIEVIALFFQICQYYCCFNFQKNVVLVNFL